MDIFALVLESDNTGGEYLSIYQLSNGQELMPSNEYYGKYCWKYTDIMMSRKDCLFAQESCSFFFENEEMDNFLPVLDSHFDLDISAASGTIERLFNV